MARVQMTRMTRWALFFLRIYLLTLLALIVVRFVKGFG